MASLDDALREQQQRAAAASRVESRNHAMRALFDRYGYGWRAVDPLTPELADLMTQFERRVSPTAGREIHIVEHPDGGSFFFDGPSAPTLRGTSAYSGFFEDLRARRADAKRQAEHQAKLDSLRRGADRGRIILIDQEYSGPWALVRAKGWATWLPAEHENWNYGDSENRVAPGPERSMHWRPANLEIATRKLASYLTST